MYKFLNVYKNGKVYFKNIVVKNYTSERNLAFSFLQLEFEEHTRTLLRGKIRSIMKTLF